MSARAQPSPPVRGFLDAVRAIAATLNDALHVRGALFAVELREEVERRKAMLLLAAIVFAFLHTALLLVTAFAVAAFWDTHRLGAIAVMAMLYAILGMATLLRLRREIAASPAPFAASLGELGRDLSEMRQP